MLFSSCYHISFAGHSLHLQQQWGILLSLPRWRQSLSMLNWRRDSDDEQRKIQHELRMEQLAIEIEQIEKETEQL